MMEGILTFSAEPRCITRIEKCNALDSSTWVPFGIDVTNTRNIVIVMTLRLPLDEKQEFFRARKV